MKLSLVFHQCSKEIQLEPTETLGATAKDNSEFFNTELTIPPINPIKNKLVAQNTRTEIQKGISIGVMGYQEGGNLGATLSVYSGTRFQVTFQNNLTEPSNIHWHGLIAPEDMDGHPNYIINSGEVFNYQFTISQRAGTYWYHPHPYGLTPKQVYMGLAGFFIVKDEEEEQLQLPSGDYELPILIQDKKDLNKDLNYIPSTHEVMWGYFGKNIIINGKYQPFKAVDRQHYRLRILKGSNARIFNLAFNDHSFFDLIGSDGGLLSEYYHVNSILLAPGERADIIVDFSKMKQGTEVYLINQTSHTNMNTNTASTEVLKFIVQAKKTRILFFQINYQKSFF